MSAAASYSPSMYEKCQLAPAPYGNVEGQGNALFSNVSLLAFILALPALGWWVVGGSLVVLPLICLFGALPLFVLYNVYWSHTIGPIRDRSKSTTLPGAPLQSYMTMKGADLAARFSNPSAKIPMETFFESYFDSKIDINMDMLELLEHRHDWARFTWTFSQLKFFLLQWIPETLWHSKIQDETQVRDHYDRGDDFYNAFLGPMMIYTSGIMKGGEVRESLEEMQQNKLELVCQKINLKAGEKMLDLGCGWGTLAVHAATKGAKVTGLTLGRNQTEHGMKRAEAAGVPENVRILCMDYRDLPVERYNKITCLEMSEHVGVLRYATFLKQVYELLEDDGTFFLQIAGLRRAWQLEDLQWGLFMAKYVFPGADASMPLNWVIEQLERAGFEVQSTETVGLHYSTTIFRWYENWMKKKEYIVGKYGVRWFRVWEFFLAYSTIIARQGSATVYQIVAHKNLNAFDRSQFIQRPR